MRSVGKVDSLWRYPVKSMRGQELKSAFVGFGGIAGDRLFAFHNSQSPPAFPYLTARQIQAMLLYTPRFREQLYPADTEDGLVDVQTPEGDIFAVDDPALIQKLGKSLKESPTLTLLRSDRAMTDCHPVSLFSLQTAQQIGDELGIAVNPRRFRANIYLSFTDAGGFQEDELVGRTLRLGAEVILTILERDRRCKMISLDPDTGVSNPAILRNVAHDHQGMAGVYAAVLTEGTVNRGDAIELLDG